ncbi:hypothetical protein VTN00DRAFT_7569 [Thermoascus crustaceus]|uniref:uncharacterized protein n=1 Tax=Thermoascus crustaceus TaxID=5088 RepID=UPI0037427A00
MAIATGGALTHGRKSPARSRNFALLSIAAIATSAWGAFRYMQRRGENLGEHDPTYFQQHGEIDPNKQTDQGTTRPAPGPTGKWWTRGS